jgi:hypothetical protein
MEDEGCVWVPRFDAVNDALCIRQAELAKLLWRQVVRPRVEQLHYLQWRCLHFIASAPTNCRGQVEQVLPPTRVGA